MKTFRTIILLLTALFIYSCDDMHDVERNDGLPLTQSSGRMLVLSEGLFNMNNSTLAYYNFDTKEFNTNYFQTKNKRGLGDTANDMILYGSKLYIAVDISSQIEVVDVNTGISLKQIPLFNDKNSSRQPRYLESSDGKVFVSCFDGTLVRIDTTKLVVDGTVNCGRNPEGLCIAAGKIYVANSGGLDFPKYDNTVSVIDIKTFKELKKITVGTNPYIIHSDSQGDVYVSSRGNYGENPYRFQKIDTYIDEVVQDFEGLNVLNFTIYDDKAYLYNYDFTTNKNWVKVFDCLSEKVVNASFISDNTVLDTPYSIQVNPADENIYITNSPGYTLWGDVLCFDKTGKLKFRINEIGLNPNKIVFLNE